METNPTPKICRVCGNTEAEVSRGPSGWMEKDLCCVCFVLGKAGIPNGVAEACTARHPLLPPDMDFIDKTGLCQDMPAKLVMRLIATIQVALLNPRFTGPARRAAENWARTALASMPKTENTHALLEAGFSNQPMSFEVAAAAARRQTDCPLEQICLSIAHARNASTLITVIPTDGSLGELVCIRMPGETREYPEMLRRLAEQIEEKQVVKDLTKNINQISP